MTEVTFFDQSIEVIKDLSIDVESLTIIDCAELYELHLPPRLVMLQIRNCPLQIISSFPSTLRVLILEDCKMIYLPPLYFTALRIICCKNTPLQSLPDLPSTIEVCLEDVSMRLLTNKFQCVL